MSENKTHWKRTFNYNYLGSYSLEENQDLTLTIKQVVKETVTSHGGRQEECTVAYFEEDVKPMILNKTNCKTIEEIYSTPYIENWIGKQITLYVDPTVKFGKETVEALRIRPTEPKAKEELTPDHKRWNQAKEYAEKNGHIKGIKKQYDVSEENEKLLLS